jgi:tryptophan-rich sensory protein
MLLYLVIYTVFGLIGGYLTAPLPGGAPIGMRFPFEPSITPPSWVFMLVWTSIYVGTAYVSYINDIHPQRSVDAKVNYSVVFFIHWLQQLAWPFIFFGLKQYGPALAIIGSMICMLRSLDVPDTPQCKVVIRAYVAWLTFAFVLNAMVVYSSYGVAWSPSFTDQVCKGTVFGKWWCSR